jgi:hypothetical protein
MNENNDKNERKEWKKEKNRKVNDFGHICMVVLQLS